LEPISVPPELTLSRLQSRKPVTDPGSPEGSDPGIFGVPTRRTSFSTEIVFGARIMRPFSSKERNAMLQLAPRGEIAVPMLKVDVF
jgi:hypothetical protein